MKKIYILIGTPASGKSTYIQTIINKLNNPFIASTDNIITSLHPELSYNEAYALESGNFKHLTKLMKQGIKDALAEGRDVIVDRTNLRSKSRKEYLKYADAFSGYEKIGVVFCIDKKEFIKRDEQRFLNEGKRIPLKVWEEMQASYQSPSKEEGFDKIIHMK
jgi:predicted kinase